MKTLKKDLILKIDIGKKMMASTVALAFLIFGSLPIVAPNPEALAKNISAESVLKAAYRAEQKAQFVGVLQTIKFDQKLKTASEIKVYQKSSKVKMEYLAPEPLKQMVMIGDGAKLCRLDLKNKKAYISYNLDQRNQIEKILKNYHIAQEKSEKLLNRQCQVLSLKPKHQFGIHKKIWLDKISGVALKTEEYDFSGNLCALSSYSQIDFRKDIKDQIFMMPDDCQKFVAQAQLPVRSVKETIKLLRFEPLRPSYLPEGYELSGRYYEMCLVGEPVAHLKYSDGLNSFSIFEHSQEGHKPASSDLNLKEVSSQSFPAVECLLPKDYVDRTQVYSMGVLMFLIMGNLPESEVKKILESVN